MAKAQYIGVGGVSRLAKAGYIGVNGVARKFTPDNKVALTGTIEVANNTITIPWDVFNKEFFIVAFLNGPSRRERPGLMKLNGTIYYMAVTSNGLQFTSDPFGGGLWNNNVYTGYPGTGNGGYLVEGTWTYYAI